MSKFSDFYNAIAADAELGAAYAKVVAEQKIPAGTAFADFSDENLTALLPIAKKAGFEFTLEEVKAYLAKSADGELSEDELEAVAGGTKGTNEQTGDGNVTCTGVGGNKVVIETGVSL